MKDKKSKGVRDDKGNILVGVGDTLKWKTPGGKEESGVIIEMDGNVAICYTEDERKVPIEC